MNSQHRAIRALLTTMAPTRAVEYVRAFELPKSEETIIIEADIRRKSVVEIALAMNLSPEAVKRYRRRGYAKIQDYIAHT